MSLTTKEAAQLRKIITLAEGLLADAGKITSGKSAGGGNRGVGRVGTSTGARAGEWPGRRGEGADKGLRVRMTPPLSTHTVRCCLTSLGYVSMGSARLTLGAQN